MAERFRLRFTFWLDLHKSDEAALVETIDQLKRERSFVMTIRDGIRIIKDLRQGNTDVLRELFPWVMTQVIEVPTSEPEGIVIGQRLDELKQILLQQPLALPTVVMPPPATPTAGDDLLEIKTASADADDKPSWNNHISMAKLLGNFDHLSPEIIEYGIRKGLIPAGNLKSKPPGKKPDRSGSSAKMMAVPLLEAPRYDREDLDLLIAVGD